MLVINIREVSHSAMVGRDTLRRLSLAAMFLAIGLILPFFTGQIPEIGNLLLPMHLPVFLCGLICGWQYGGIVGLVMPVMRSFMFGNPPLYPSAMAMSAELAIYGFIIGLIYGRFKKQNIASVYIALVSAMLVGRAMWGGAQVLLLGMTGSTFTWQAFVAGAFFKAIPGIVIQLVLVPTIMSILHLTGLYRFRKHGFSAKNAK